MQNTKITLLWRHTKIDTNEIADIRSYLMRVFEISNIIYIADFDKETIFSLFACIAVQGNN